MRSLWVALVALALAVSAKAEQCTAPALDKCPNRYVERCRTDPAFMKQNSDKCLRFRNSKQAEDPVECNAEEACRQGQCKAAAEKDKITVSIQDFFKGCGLVNCPFRMEKIKIEFSQIGAQLNDELGKFKGILDLEPGNIVSKDALCKYTREQMATFKELAKGDHGKLEITTRRLKTLQTCSNHVMLFFTHAKRDNWKAELRGVLIKEVQDDRNAAAREEATAKTQIDKLIAAPQKMDELGEIYDLACP